jgi:hypothetical protein
MARVPGDAAAVIKYTRGHNTELDGHYGSPQAMHEAAAKRWPEDLREFGSLAHYVSHDLGEVYGVPIWLDCYLIGPISPSPGVPEAESGEATSQVGR